MLKLNNVSNYSSPSMILQVRTYNFYQITISRSLLAVLLDVQHFGNHNAAYDPASTQIWLIPEDLKHGTLPHSRGQHQHQRQHATAQFNHTFHWMTETNPLDCNKEAQTSPGY
jgi:hypothetical protein